MLAHALRIRDLRPKRGGVDRRRVRPHHDRDRHRRVLPGMRYGGARRVMQADAQLLVAARAGDPDAMQTLLVRLRPDIRRYAAYQCGRATALDDVVQEALIV